MCRRLNEPINNFDRGLFTNDVTGWRGGEGGKQKWHIVTLGGVTHQFSIKKYEIFSQYFLSNTTREYHTMEMRATHIWGGKWLTSFWLKNTKFLASIFFIKHISQVSYHGDESYTYINDFHTMEMFFFASPYVHDFILRVFQKQLFSEKVTQITIYIW